MAGWDDVRRLALALPEVEETAARAWQVRGRTFAWDRPLRRGDLEALGEAAPDGEVLALYVEDTGVKAALLAAHPDVLFTTPHFDGHRSVLVRLEQAPGPLLEELVPEAWLVRAPKRVAAAWLAGRG